MAESTSTFGPTVELTEVAASETAKILKTWLLTPLSIGGNIPPLEGYRGGMDIAEMDFVSDQRYTSFSVLSFSSSAHFSLSYSAIRERRGQASTQTDTNRYNITLPTEEDLLAAPASAQNANFVILQPTSQDQPPVTSQVDYMPHRMATTSDYATSDELRNTPFSESYNAIASELKSKQQDTAVSLMFESMSVVDSGWSVFCNALKNSGSYMDMAPMIRTALLSYSLSLDTAKFDTGPHRTLRNLSYKYTGTKIAAVSYPANKYRLLAMPFDTFTSFMAGNLYNTPPPPPYDPSNMDVSWTAVPLSNTMLRAPFIREYITSFFASDLTYATVSKSYDVQSQEVNGTYISMPNANLAYLQGPNNVLLVLTDLTSASSIRIGTLTIPVHNGTTATPTPPTPLFPSDWATEWSSYFIDANKKKIQQNLSLCWNHMSKYMSVHNTAGQSLSCASELISSTPPGIYVSPKAERFSYDYTRILIGAFSVTGRSDKSTLPLADGSPYLTTLIKLNDEEASQQIKNVMCGVNLASISPIHIPASGLTKIEFNTHDSTVSSPDRQPAPENTATTYSVKTASSLKRIAISMGLINRSSSQYQFDSAEELPRWLHTLSHANAANTCAFLQSNDIPTRDWSGFNNTLSTWNRFFEMDSLKRDVTNDFVRHIEMIDIMENCPNYSDDWFYFAYSGMDPFSNKAWYQQSIIPTHVMIQWNEKMKTASCPEHTPAVKNELLSVYKDRKFSLPITTERKKYLEWIVGSFNTLQYHPLLIDKTATYPVHPVLGSWIEQSQYQSMDTSSGRWPNRANTATMAHTESLLVTFDGCIENRKLYVADSAYCGANWNANKPKVTPLVWPDPPTKKENDTV